MESIEVQLARILNDYTEEVQNETEAAAKKVGTEGRKIVQKLAPKKYGRYQKSWTLKRETKGKGSAFIIHARGKSASITHLLEKGHALRQGGRARAFPHIKPAEDYVIDEYPKELERRLSK